SVLFNTSTIVDAILISYPIRIFRQSTVLNRFISMIIQRIILLCFFSENYTRVFIVSPLIFSIIAVVTEVDVISINPFASRNPILFDTGTIVDTILISYPTRIFRQSTILNRLISMIVQ